MRRYARAFAAVMVASALSAVALIGPAATPASAHVGTDPRVTEFLMALTINGLRAQHGLAPLHFDGALSDSARSWSGSMAGRGSLAHSGFTGYAASAENVGAGAHPPTIMDYFLASAPHRANILGNYTRMGLGVVVDRNGTVWVTQRFVR